ncbi:MAG: MGMT family protein [Bacteroidetes bacterium]|nr:MGMT family protein [Bacteroidota bacterium]
MKISDKNKDFFALVYEVVKQIPKGRVTNYSAIANYLGTKRSSRMVGWAMNASHIYKEIPAHRVVNRQGLLTGKMHFDYPTEMEELLMSEGIEVINDQIVNFQIVFWDPEVELAIA